MSNPNTTKTVGADQNVRVMHANQLAGHIAATNRVNAKANELQPMFQAAFAPFIGKKVLTQSGLVKALKDKINALMPDYHEFNVWKDSSDYSIRYSVKCHENVQSRQEYDRAQGYYTAAYAEATFYIGELSGDTLAKLIDHTPLRIDYTAEEIIQLRKNVDTTEAAARAALSALYPFKRFDQ